MRIKRTHIAENRVLEFQQVAVGWCTKQRFSRVFAPRIRVLTFVVVKSAVMKLESSNAGSISGRLQTSKLEVLDEGLNKHTFP